MLVISTRQRWDRSVSSREHISRAHQAEGEVTPEPLPGGRRDPEEGQRLREADAVHATCTAATVVHVLETAPNYLISELVMRPLRPKG